jgi:hypothetical protein
MTDYGNGMVKDMLGRIPLTAWPYLKGSEYFAANPILVPSMMPIIAAARLTTHGSLKIDVGDSPFPSKRGGKDETEGESKSQSTAARKSGADIFFKLPPELIHELVGHLGSKDIASLRLASRAFTHLPRFLWHRLVVEEMPWLYEAWSTTVTPYPWVTKDAVEQVQLEEIRRRASVNYSAENRSRAEAVQEEMPEIFDEWYADHIDFEWKGLEKSVEEREMERLRPVALPIAGTNWYVLYREITANWDKLKGLQNRKIWDDVVEIVRRIRDIRDRE